MKLYTRTGDDGSTGLFGGDRVGKDALRVEVYGTVDELNAALGLAAAIAGPPELRPVLEPLPILQSRLFDLGADLCTPHDSPHASKIRRTGPGDVLMLEKMIDEACEGLPELRQFILPGGCELAARLHLARTICRRGERLLVALSRVEIVGGDTIIFLNRLSDLLFAMARRANLLVNIPDIPWRPAD